MKEGRIWVSLEVSLEASLKVSLDVSVGVGVSMDVNECLPCTGADRTVDDGQEADRNIERRRSWRLKGEGCRESAFEFTYMARSRTAGVSWVPGWHCHLSCHTKKRESSQSQGEGTSKTGLDLTLVSEGWGGCITHAAMMHLVHHPPGPGLMRVVQRRWLESVGGPADG